SGAAVVLEDRTLLAAPVLVKDINRGSSFPFVQPRDLAVVGTQLIYTAHGMPSGKDVLVASDGTMAGTRMLIEFEAVGFSNVVFGGELYFTADDGGGSGFELWKTDGTVAGTQLVKDIVPGPLGSSASDYVAVGDLFFFTATTPETGRELWKSDGTAAGTVLVKDVVPGLDSSNADRLTLAVGRLFFETRDAASGLELWTSDGTAAGTFQLKDINPGPADSLYGYTTYVEADGFVYFRADDGVHGKELWRTDGTSAGTTLVKDINPGSASGLGLWAAFLGTDGDTVYFGAWDAVHGYEPWKSDGTEAGTQMIADVAPGDSSSLLDYDYSVEFTVVDDLVYFAANEYSGTGTDNGTELWVSDGTAGGTHLVKDLLPGGRSSSNPIAHVAFDGELYFYARGQSASFWRTDGTAAGTIPVTYVGGYNFVEFNGQLYFLGTGSNSAIDLWKSDGTTAGTVRVGNIVPGEYDSNPRVHGASDNLLFFRAADDLNGERLWRSDGTPDGTFALKDLHPDEHSYGASGGMVNDEFYFTATFSGSPNYGDLFKTDGTPAGTVLVKDFNTVWGRSPSNFMEFNGRLLFIFDDGVNGSALWTSNGTSSGTVILRTGVSGGVSGSAREPVIVNGRLYFVANDAVYGREIWSTDGTVAGTTVIDAVPGAGSLQPTLIGALKDEIYFSTGSILTDRNLWVTDGTVAGTRLVTDVYPGYRSFFTVGDKAYFQGNDGVHGAELWVTDGTSSGTRLVKDITVGAGHTSFTPLHVLDGYLIFSAGEDRGDSREQLWRTDGTEAGTTLLIAQGATNSSYSFQVLRLEDDSLLFTHDDGVHGREIWKTDGTAAGTALFMDVRPGSVSSDSHGGVTFRGRTYFVATTQETGEAIWVTDGTVAGTELVGEIHGLSRSNSIRFLSLIGSKLFLAAETQTAGDELWMFDLNNAPASLTLLNAGVVENSPIGTAVGQLRSADVDPGETFTYSLVAGPGDAGNTAFVIDGDMLRVARELNFETQSLVPIRVRSTDSGGHWIESTFTISVSDVNEFVISAVTDSSGQADFVPENSPNGTAVGVTASAFDPDGTTNAVTYSLLSDAGGRFAIDTSTGVVTVAKSALLDREAAAEWSIVVRATSADGSSSSSPYWIAVGDVNEFKLTGISDASAAPNAVAENSATGTPVGITAVASDGDATNNGVTYSLLNSAGGRFTIHPVTGVVTVANGGLLDREAAREWAITVMARSQDGSTNSKAFAIRLIDVDEFTLGAVGDRNGAENRVAEGAATGATVGVTASAIDGDADAAAARYVLIDDAGGRFAINASTGVVTVANGSLIDREIAASHVIVVRAIGGNGAYRTNSFRISVDDVSEFKLSGISDADAAPNAVVEKAANGTRVGITAFAFDADATNNSVRYSLLDNAGGRFAIDPLTGVITVANGALLDRKGARQWAISVLATSSDGTKNSKAFAIAVLGAG
ncbi:MAG TPA: ELWxxDGT repeat protein, partial [Caulifigura sp.]|nr:ELWxxDGT repeat protein [Caulifigura sp.]